MLSLLGMSRKKLNGRHVAAKTPWWRPLPSEQNEVPDARPALSAEHHVLEVRKLAARECPRDSRGETFAVTYHAPSELYIEMAMQFIAHTEQGRLEDGHEPFIYLGCSGNKYTFQVV